MAAKSTITSTTTTTKTTTTSTTGSTSDKVANQTTAAVDDFFGASLGVTEEIQGAFKLNVLANDPGSATLLALYTYAPSTPSKSTPTTATTVNGATVTIKDGAVFYQATSLSSAKFQHLAEGATATDSFAYVIKMSNGALSTAVATVTVVGKNDAAKITSVTGDLVETVSEDGGSISGGTITVDDIDDNEAVMTGATGEYGSISFTGAVGSAQAWTYQLSAKAQTLAAGEIANETLTVKSADGTQSRAITVTIQGANDTASISGDSVGNVTEDGMGVASGTLTVSDIDHDQNVFASTTSSSSNTFGSFTFGNGAWAFNLNKNAQTMAEGDSAEASLSVASADGTATRTIRVTLTGVNDLATISGGFLGDVTEDGVGIVSGQLVVSDVDHDQNVFDEVTSSTSGEYGDFSFDNGNWSFTLNGNAQTLAEGESETATLTVSSKDGTDHQDITVTIRGFNDVATITGTAAQTISEDDGGAEGATLKVDDVDHDENIFDEATSSTAGRYGDFSFDNGKWSFSLNGNAQTLGAGKTATETLTVSSKDGTATQDIVVTINGVNDAAKISGESYQTISEDDGGAQGATLTVDDIDQDEGGFQAASPTAGRYGNFTFDDGAWTFALNEKAQTLAGGAIATETLTVASIDGTATQDIVVTINGVNDAATISGDTFGQLTEDGVSTVRGSLDVSDIDFKENVFASLADSALLGTYGTFTFNDQTGHWSYTQSKTDAQAAAVQALNSGDVRNDELTVSSLDGTASKTIKVSVLGLDEPKVFTITMDQFQANPTQYINGFTETSILDVPNMLKYDGATPTTAGLDLNFSTKKADYDVILVGVMTIDDTTKDGDPSQII